MQRINKIFSEPYLLPIVIGLAGRLLPHAPNFTPIGAIALFTAAKFSVRKSIIITLVIMIFSDLIIGVHTTLWVVYLSMLITSILGGFLKNSGSPVKIGGTALASAVIFFLVTNFGVWTTTSFMYPKTWAGLIECYIMAIPFFRNSLIGDLFYTGLFFYGYEIVRNQNISLAGFNNFIKIRNKDI